jgi:hypothetical protein
MATGNVTHSSELKDPLTIAKIAAKPFPGIRTEAHTDRVRLYGHRDSLRATGLIPEGKLFPDECNAKRGVRWVDSGGNRFVLSYGWQPKDHFCLMVCASKAELRAMQHNERVSHEVASIDRELKSLDLTEKEFRQQMARHILLGWIACERDLETGQAWAYSSDVVEAIREKVEEIRELLWGGDLLQHPEQIQALKLRKAALADSGLQKMLASIPMAFHG